MALTYRSEKGEALTITELDNNFRYFTGSHAITGSLIVTEGITADITGSASDSVTTASAALNVITFTKGDASTFDITVDTGSAVDTGSLVTTASAALNVITFTKGDASTFDVTIDTGSASTDTGSLLITASVSLNTITFTKGDASTFDITVDTGSSGGSAFPYTGNAEITGSLSVTGNTNLGNDNADLLTVKGKTQMGYTTGTPSQNSAVAIFDEGFTYDYSLYTKGYNYFDNGDTTFDSHDLLFDRSTIYVGANTLAPAVVPTSDSANIGFAIGRPDNETSQQLILSYQGGAGRIIAKETNASAPQLRIELLDSGINTTVWKFTKSTIEINTALLPTTEPSIGGQLWLSGSAGSNSKVLCVRS